VWVVHGGSLRNHDGVSIGGVSAGGLNKELNLDTVYQLVNKNIVALTVKKQFDPYNRFTALKEQINFFLE